jgi:hypothetical protein
MSSVSAVVLTGVACTTRHVMPSQNSIGDYLLLDGF